MSSDEIQAQIEQGLKPPTDLNVCIRALWYDALGDWEAAHNLVGDLDGSDAAWVHAYLHRKEGDLWNADYWYRRARKTRSEQTIAQEWQHLLNSLA